PLTATSSMRTSLPARRPMVSSGLSSGNSFATTPSTSSARTAAGRGFFVMVRLYATYQDDRDVIRPAGLVGRCNQGCHGCRVFRLRQHGGEPAAGQRLVEAVGAQQVDVAGLQRAVDDRMHQCIAKTQRS